MVRAIEIEKETSRSYPSTTHKQIYIIVAMMIKIHAKSEWFVYCAA